MYANSPDHFYLSIIGLETGGGEPVAQIGNKENQGEFNNNSWLLEQDEIVVLA